MADSSNRLDHDEEQGEDYVITVDDPDTEELDFNHCKIARICNLESLTQIKVLGFRQNLVKHIEGVNQLTTLCELTLCDNQISVIENIDALINLRLLDLSFNRIKKIQNLELLVQLEKLYLCDNKISKIEGLSSLTNLKLLELGSNKIRVIENLETLVNLNELFLGKNKISTIDGLSSITELSILDLQSNRLLLIQNLEPQNKLDQLYLSQNGIEHIKNIPSKSTLQTLDLAGNKIASIEEEELNLPSLEELWLNDNLISDWKDVDHLKALSNLKTIYLERNPIWHDPSEPNRGSLMSTPAPMLENYLMSVSSGMDGILPQSHVVKIAALVTVALCSGYTFWHVFIKSRRSLQEPRPRALSRRHRRLYPVIIKPSIEEHPELAQRPLGGYISRPTLPVVKRQVQPVNSSVAPSSWDLRGSPSLSCSRELQPGQAVPITTKVALRRHRFFNSGDLDREDLDDSMSFHSGLFDMRDSSSFTTASNSFSIL